jgi:hypothetical protein
MRCGRNSQAWTLRRKSVKVSANFGILFTKSFFKYRICNNFLLVFGHPSIKRAWAAWPSRMPLLTRHTNPMPALLDNFSWLHQQTLFKQLVVIFLKKKLFEVKQIKRFFPAPKNISFLNMQALDQEKNVVGNHMNRCSITHRVCSVLHLHASAMYCTARCALGPPQVFFPFVL